jgi:hypothetical protein
MHGIGQTPPNLAADLSDAEIFVAVPYALSSQRNKKHSTGRPSQSMRKYILHAQVPMQHVYT